MMMQANAPLVVAANNLWEAAPRLSGAEPFRYSDPN
jgi:hypothetical protein